MSPVTLISLIKNELENLKKQGIEKVSIDELMDYLSKIELANQNLSDLSLVELERYKAQLNMWVEQQKSQTKLWAEGFKSVILSGQNALRSALLINGGTAIALLAYIGRLKIAGLDQASTLAFPLAIFVVVSWLLQLIRESHILHNGFTLAEANGSKKLGLFLT